MTTSRSGGLQGDQRPRIYSVPDAPTSAGQEAIELAESAGLILDPWQQFTLDCALRENKDGKWTSFEVGILCSRQNGKGGIIEARELAGLFLFEERLIVHTAHQFDTSLEAFNRLLELIQSTPDLDRRVAKVSNAHGKEGIELLNGCRIRFKARTRNGGRGFSGDLVILDEAMIIPEEAMGALMPTMSARENPQLWYLGSAVDEEVHDDGMTFTKVRNRGVGGSDPSLCWIEFSAPDERKPNGELVVDPADPRVIAQANPAVGHRLSLAHIAKERRSMPRRMYEVERLGIGYWPSEDEEVERPIDPEVFESRVDRDPNLTDSIAIAIDGDPAGKWVSISAAVLKANGGVHGEIGFHEKPGPGIVPFIVSLVSRWDPCAIIIDSRGPVGYLRQDLINEGIEPEDVTASSMASASVGLQRAVEDDEFTHTGDPLLVDAVKGATKRKIGDGWGFARNGDATISPLVSVALARQGVLTYGVSKKRPPAAPTGGTSGPARGRTDELDVLTAAF